MITGFGDASIIKHNNNNNNNNNYVVLCVCVCECMSVCNYTHIIAS